jgi:hypothetical protein
MWLLIVWTTAKNAQTFLWRKKIEMKKVSGLVANRFQWTRFYCAIDFLKSDIFLLEGNLGGFEFF